MRVFRERKLTSHKRMVAHLCAKIFFVCTLLNLTEQRIFAASATPAAPPPFVAEHEAIVRFKSYEGVLYEVIWETYGLMFHGAISAEAVLERNLLRGNDKGFFRAPLGHLCFLLKYDLELCLQNRVFVHYNEGRALPLGVKQLEAMCFYIQNKRWEALRAGAGHEDNLLPGEFRILFAKGGYSCLNAHRSEDLCFYDMHQSPLFRQAAFERTHDFAMSVKLLAQKALSELQRVTCMQGEKVCVRHVDANGVVRSIVWNISNVRDRHGRRACDFLHDGVMQGTSLGYTDENAVQHFPFVNEDICTLLKKSLRKDMKRNKHLEPVPSANPLLQKDVKNMPYMSWTVVPQGMLKYGSVPHTWSLTFSSVTLEGVPLHDQDFMQNKFVLSGYLYPRNYLWALDFDALSRKKTEPSSWYRVRVRSQRMNWHLSRFNKRNLWNRICPGNLTVAN